ncbi:MAG: hypothetical protein Q8Q65_04635 [bacterium]|nr:hypothetical protein [bacterium]
MKIETLKKKFKNQWILAEVLDAKPDTLEPLDAKVIEHSASRAKTYKAMRESKSKRLMHFYNGPVPKKGYAVAF